MITPSNIPPPSPTNRFAQTIFELLKADGAIIMVCKTCIVRRNKSGEDIRDGVSLGSSPDVMRMISNASGHIQFN